MNRVLQGAEARAILGRHARTFSIASAFLPAATRDDAAIVYAFCRLVDDVVDEAQDGEAIASIRDELVGSRTPRPELAAFLEVAARRSIPLSAATELVQGCASDLGPVRVADFPALADYSYLVAGTVGRMMAPLLGAKNAAANQHAVDLGIAMQLTNIARDVAEDAERDRVYLPRSWLAEVGVAPSDLVEQVADPEAVFAVVCRLVRIADHYYRRGEAGLVYLPFRTRLAIGVASRVYRAIGLAVMRRGPPALKERTVLGAAERFARTLEGILAACKILPLRSA